MKIMVLSIALTMSAVASAVPALLAAPKLAMRATSYGTFDCSYCTSMLSFCFENGHTHGQEGCKQTCREHVCHRTPECKKCHGEFDLCPEQSRFVH